MSDLTGTTSESPNTNPYFWNGNLPLNDWYLLVGYVRPSGDATPANASATKVYNRFGQVVANGTDFKWLSTTTTSQHRAYLFYCVETGIQQEFWNPRVEQINSVNDPIDVLFQAPETSPKNITLTQPGTRTLLALSYSSTALSSSVATATYPYDTDSDGLADAWEMQYFGNLGQNGTGDWDGDGVTNLQEFQLHSDPTFYSLLIYTPLQ